MRNISSAVMSLAAMVLSSFTTYLTFFDSRYTLTAAVAGVSGQSNRGYGSNGEQKTINFRFYATPSIILSNRGTRALVVSEVAVVRSEDKTRCVAAADAERRQPFRLNLESNRTEAIEPFIVEPGSVQAQKIEVSLPDVDQAVATDAQFALEPDSALWCLEWTVFDPNGKRHESLMPAFTTDVAYSAEEGEDKPGASFKLDYAKQPVTILSRALF